MKTMIMKLHSTKIESKEIKLHNGMIMIVFKKPLNPELSQKVLEELKQNENIEFQLINDVIAGQIIGYKYGVRTEETKKHK